VATTPWRRCALALRRCGTHTRPAQHVAHSCGLPRLREYEPPVLSVHQCVRRRQSQFLRVTRAPWTPASRSPTMYFDKSRLVFSSPCASRPLRGVTSVCCRNPTSCLSLLRKLEVPRSARRRDTAAPAAPARYELALRAIDVLCVHAQEPSSALAFHLRKPVSSLYVRPVSALSGSSAI